MDDGVGSFIYDLDYAEDKAGDCETDEDDPSATEHFICPCCTEDLPDSDNEESEIFTKWLITNKTKWRENRPIAEIKPLIGLCGLNVISKEAFPKRLDDWKRAWRARRPVVNNSTEPVERKTTGTKTDSYYLVVWKAPGTAQPTGHPARSKPGTFKILRDRYTSGTEPDKNKGRSLSDFTKNWTLYPPNNSVYPDFERYLAKQTDVKAVSATTDTGAYVLTMTWADESTTVFTLYIACSVRGENDAVKGKTPKKRKVSDDECIEYIECIDISAYLGPRIGGPFQEYLNTLKTSWRTKREAVHSNNSAESASPVEALVSRVIALEMTLNGETNTGSLTKRVKALEQALWGEVKEGDLTARVAKLEASV